MYGLHKISLQFMKNSNLRLLNSHNHCIENSLGIMCKHYHSQGIFMLVLPSLLFVFLRRVLISYVLI